MKQNYKLKLARGMMSKEETGSHVSPFLSKAWGERQASIEKRVSRNIEKAKELKALKKNRIPH